LRRRSYCTSAVGAARGFASSTTSVA
jgi:hypothetical protein